MATAEQMVDTVFGPDPDESGEQSVEACVPPSSTCATR